MPSDSSNQPNLQETTSNANFISFIYIFIGIIFGIGIIAIVILTLNYFSFISLTSLSPILSNFPHIVSKSELTPTPRSTPTGILPLGKYTPDPEPYNICFSQHIGYPANRTILSSHKTELGIYAGTIVSLSQEKKTITISSSVDQSQFSFFVGYILSKIFTATLGKHISLSSLHSGNNVVVFFPCYQNPGKFELTEIQVK